MPEMFVRSVLHREGFRFRLKGRRLVGRPDVILPAWNSVVFVHGCFWHRHRGCKFSYTPKSNSAFWKRKFLENVARDARAVQSLRNAGWHVFTVWSCQATETRVRSLASRIRRTVP